MHAARTACVLCVHSRLPDVLERANKCLKPPPFIWEKFIISVGNVCSQLSVGKTPSLLFVCVCAPPALEIAFDSEVFYVSLVSSMVFGSEGLFQLSCGLDKESRIFVDITSGFLLLYTMANGEGKCKLCTSLTGASLEFAVRS